MLSSNAQAVYEELKRFYKEKGYMPTYRKIMERAGCSSTSVVRTRLREIEEAGLISVDWGESRAIRLAEK